VPWPIERRSRSGEEDTVQAGRRDLGEAAGKFKGQRMAHLKGRGIVHGSQLRIDRIRDFRSPMTGIDAPKPSRAVENFSIIVRSVKHAMRFDEHARRRLELAVGGVGHP
jgi:hypothetical protein